MGAVMPPLFTSFSSAATSKKIKEFYFTASPAKINLGTGREFVARTYNGQVPGPEIRVQEGDIIRVVLKNDLSEGTTIHWHGIPLQNAMDGVPGITQPAVRPGETFVYEFEAKPAGSFIYHSHAKYQLDQGLYGPLIIEPSHSEQSYDREYALMLEDWVMKDGGGTARTQRRPPMGRGMMGGMMHGSGQFNREEGPLLEPYYDAYAVNGRIYTAIPPLEVSRGDRVKLRLLNPSSSTIYYLRLAGHALTITHLDGNPVMPVETEVLQIGMGERVDAIFQANNPGYWFLAASEEGSGESRLRIPIHYRGIQQKEAVMPEFHRGLRFADYGDFKALRPAAEIGFEDSRVFEQSLSGGMHSPLWSINGQLYPQADPLFVRKGERVRLAYGNHSMMPHPMHLHGHFFKVVNPGIPREFWISKDTIVVDHMQRIDVEFMADNPGKWFHHCHNLYHMEAGMANVIEYTG